MQDEIRIFEDYIRAQRLKHSKPRRDIVEVFLESDGHYTAQELFQQVKQKNASVGFATVYRTLKLLEECGLARTMDYGDGTLRYEPNRFQHHHIICTACNRTIEFLSPELEVLLRKVQEDHHFTPQMHAVRILSVCTDCTQVTSQPRRQSTSLEAILSRDALQVAITNEERGLHFYSLALEATTDTATRTVFERLVEEEKRHLAALQKEYEALCQAHPALISEPNLLYFDYDRLEDIFPQSRLNVMQTVQSVSAAEALYMAMAAERRSYEFFSEYADKVEYPEGRAIFKKFANEEQRHLSMIRHAYDALQDKG
ncbi:MAG: transcriptional repressor [Candidatus Tectimicrobiota bacterium]